MANYMVQWGPKGFLVSADKIVPFADLSTAFTLNSEYREDTSGNDPIYVRGRAPQSISFTTSYYAAAGVDPRNQMRQWYDLIGMTYPLYIGGVQFGPPLLQLQSVDLSEFIQDMTGRILGVHMTITLAEYTGDAKTISQKTFDAWTGKTSATEVGPSDKETELLKPTITYPTVGVN